MRVQVLLQVEVGQLLIGLHAQKSAQLGIRVDVVLVLQVVLLHVVVHRLRDLRAGEERVLGLAQERQELLRHLRGDLEDAGLARGRIHALREGRAARAPHDGKDRTRQQQGDDEFEDRHCGQMGTTANAGKGAALPAPIPPGRNPAWTGA